MGQASPAPDAEVRSKFTVKDVYQLPDGAVEYSVEYGDGSKKAFEELRGTLSKLGSAATLSGSKSECVLTVKPLLKTKTKRSRVPVILTLLTLTSIIIFSLLERIVYAKFSPDQSGYLVLLAYGVGVIALMGAHEGAHWYYARRSGSEAPTPYLIPGIPNITAFFPALGAVTLQREPAVNRDGYFDLLVVGPFAALVLAVVLYAVGTLTAFQSAIPLSGNESVNSFLSVHQINPSAIQYAIDWILSPFAPQAASGYVMLSPVGDAATVGFLLTFVGLLPLGIFDGGQLASLAWGQGAARLASYAGVFALIAVDTPYYWAVAIVVLILAGRSVQPQLLDEVSGLSSSRRWLYIAVFALALLSVPIPQTIGTFGSG